MKALIPATIVVALLLTLPEIGEAANFCQVVRSTLDERVKDHICRPNWASAILQRQDVLHDCETAFVRSDTSPQAFQAASSVELTSTFGNRVGARTLQYGAVERTLRATLSKAGATPNTVNQVATIFAHRRAFDIDAPAVPGDFYRLSFQQSNQDSRAPAVHIVAVVARQGGKVFTAEWFTPVGQQPGAYYAFDGSPLEDEEFSPPVVTAVVTSGFGWRLHPTHGVLRFHTGVDLAAPADTLVRAAAPGVVTFLGFEKRGYGRYIIVTHENGMSTLYAHLASSVENLKTGDNVESGQTLGRIGRTGDATGPHLHFEVRDTDRFIDPMLALGNRNANRLTRDDSDALHQQTIFLKTQLEELGIGPGNLHLFMAQNSHIIEAGC